jgi:hypothetical protein
VGDADHLKDGEPLEGRNWFLKLRTELQVAVIGGIFGLLAAAVAGGFTLAASGNSPPSPSPAPSTAVATPSELSGVVAHGAFTEPTEAASGVISCRQLLASGTEQGLQPGYGFLTFLQFSGTDNYWLGEKVSSGNGRWSGKIDIGDPGSITLWLEEFSLTSIDEMTHDQYHYNNGFPGTLLSSFGARVVSFVDITANGPHCHS